MLVKSLENLECIDEALSLLEGTYNDCPESGDHKNKLVDLLLEFYLSLGKKL